MKHVNIFVTLCALLLVQTASAANKVTYIDGYELYDDYTAVLKSGAETTGKIALPSTIKYDGKDYTLTTIAEQAFLSNENITSVIIPNSVSSIEKSAFAGCYNLTSVTIGAFVQSIGEQAFDDCDNLKEVIFYPTTPPAMGYCVFYFKNTEFKINVPNRTYENVLNDSYINPYTIYHHIQTFDIQGKKIYFDAVVDAISIAADRVVLSVEEELAIYGYKAAIISAEDISLVPENELAAHRLIAIAGVPRGGLTDDEQMVMDGKIAAINSATSLAGIYTAQKEAFKYIAFLQGKQSALAAIEEAKQGITHSAYLNNLVKEQVDAINSATDVATIDSNKNTAISKLNNAVPTYKAALSELPTNGTTGNGVRITLGTNSIELMNPDKVEFIRK